MHHPLLLRRLAALAALAYALIAAPGALHAQPHELVNFTGGNHVGARVCFFEGPSAAYPRGVPLYRGAQMMSGHILRPDVSMLAGHGNAGCSLATVPTQGLSELQIQETLGDYTWRVQRSRQAIGLQMSCRSGLPQGAEMSTAERCALQIATPGRTTAALTNTQIGFTGVLNGAPQAGGLCQTDPLFGNPRGVIVYQGYAARAGAPSTAACVEARYVPDGRPLLESLCRDGRTCTLLDTPPPGAQPMAAAGGGRALLGTAGRACGNVVFIAGTEVLMYQAEEFSRYADELDQASLRGDGVPFNADACQPWCGDYWQQAGWYYGVCNSPPDDPRWAGSPGLPRCDAANYNEVLGARLRDSFGRNSHVYRCWQRGLDPAPAGFAEFPTLRVVRQPRDLRDMLMSHGPDCFRPYDEFLVPDVERIPYYLPRGWRARQPQLACPDGRGGQIQPPRGVDPPYEGGGCQAAGGDGAALGVLLAGVLLAGGPLAGRMVRRRRRGG